jgi:hypothetical protein
MYHTFRSLAAAIVDIQTNQWAWSNLNSTTSLKTHLSSHRSRLKLALAVLRRLRGSEVAAF